MKRSKKGFTLIEMLIVIAIIAILVAIAIPTFSSQLNAAKERVDEANLRSAKSLAVAEYMLAGVKGEATYNVGTDTEGNLYVTTGAAATALTPEAGGATALTVTVEDGAVTGTTW